MRRRRGTWSRSSEAVSVARLVTPKWASIALSHDASVGVDTGVIFSRRSRAKKCGWCAGYPTVSPGGTWDRPSPRRPSTIASAAPATSDQSTFQSVDVLMGQEPLRPGLGPDPHEEGLADFAVQRSL